MSQELHYTSVPRGLKPGSRGFGTVAATAGLPETLADRLEALSVYEAVYPPGDPSAALNPIAYSHVRLNVGDRPHDVLSRIGPAGLDYSGRPNKYAHHVILAHEERPEGGPAWLLEQPGFLRRAWEGEPRMLAEGTPVPRGDRPPGVAAAWQALAGDAGWAGVLAESFLADPRRPVFLVFRPGIEVLPMFVEAVALLPPSRRWDVEFSTYLTSLPPGVWYTWRGVLDGSAQARMARRLPNALILDLGRPPGRASGGPLVHLARTGERLQVPEPAVPVIRHESGPPPEITAGPPPRRTTSGPARRPGAAKDGDWLPDLAAQLAVDVSLLGGDRIPRRRRPPAAIATAIAVGLVLVLLTAFSLSPDLRRRLGLGPARTVAAAGPAAKPAPVVTARAAPEKAPEPRGQPVASTKETAKPEVAKPDVAKAEVAKVKAPPPEAKEPERPAPRPAGPPLLLAFDTPGFTGSALGSSDRPQRTIVLPEDTEDRVALLNGSDFKLTAVAAAPHTWEVATKTGSGLGGGSTLARLHRADGRTWRFEWTKGARPQSASVEGLKDAILELRGQDGRPIRVLLRGVEREIKRPLVVWKDQRILFDKLEPRIKSVNWGGNPDALDKTRWKPLIRRWRVVLSRSPSDQGDDKGPRQVFEPEPFESDKDPGASPALERDLIRHEVKLKLAIDPARPSSIDVRIEPDPEAVREGDADRAARLAEFKKVTPRAKDGHEQEPLEYRRGELRKLLPGRAEHEDEIKDLEREIAALESITAILRTEELLSQKAWLELSVVIGLDVEGAGILDIVRIGEFAAGR